MHDGKKLDVFITYAPNKDELRDNHVQRSDTLGSLKARVLTAFGLKEGVDERGKLMTFTIFRSHHELKDLAQKLGDIAGADELLRLELVRERYYFIYGEKKIFSTLEVATGAQIKAVEPTFDPNHELILEGHGHHQDRVIPDGESVTLEVGEGHPEKHFFSKPPTNFGAHVCCRPSR